jgi:hypothetical protein
MSEEDIVRANFWNESTGHCACCGKQSKTIWGDLADSSRTKAIYFVQWTVNEPGHKPHVDIVLGPWETEPRQMTTCLLHCYTSPE